MFGSKSPPFLVASTTAVFAFERRTVDALGLDEGISDPSTFLIAARLATSLDTVEGCPSQDAVSVALNRLGLITLRVHDTSQDTLTHASSHFLVIDLTAVQPTFKKRESWAIGNFHVPEPPSLPSFSQRTFQKKPKPP